MAEGKWDGVKEWITYTSVLNVSAYGAKGTYSITGTHQYELRNGLWTIVD